MRPMRAAGAGASACSFFLRRFFFDGVAASSVKTFTGDGAGAFDIWRVAASLRSTCARVDGETCRWVGMWSRARRGDGVGSCSYAIDETRGDGVERRQMRHGNKPRGPAFSLKAAGRPCPLHADHIRDNASKSPPPTHKKSRTHISVEAF